MQGVDYFAEQLHTTISEPSWETFPGKQTNKADGVLLTEAATGVAL